MAGEPESLDEDEGLERRRRRHWYDRLIMLSDGVFAIAITLMAFSLHGPPTSSGEDDLWATLAPQLMGYSMSFIVVAVYWLAHRRFIAMITRVDAPITVLNLIVLALVALLPPATQLLQTHGPTTPVMVIYSALVVAIGLAIAVLWAYAALVANLVFSEVSLAVRWFLLALMVVTPPLFLAFTALIPDRLYWLVPLALVGLFLVGWPMRLWVLARLERRKANAQTP